jgi:serine/threonine protein kinase
MIREAFSRAAGKPVDFLEAILRERGDLREKIATGELTPEYPEKGDFAFTVIIGDEVFKGPKSREFVDGFDKEPEILKQLAGKGLPIPEVKWESRDSLIFSMTSIPGVALGERFEERTSVDEQRSLAKEIICFVIDMANALQPQEGKFIMHLDLNYNNILIDTETKKLSVIDFGIVRYRNKDKWFPNSILPAAFKEMLQQEYDARKAEMPGPPVIKGVTPQRMVNRAA